MIAIGKINVTEDLIRVGIRRKCIGWLSHGLRIRSKQVVKPKLAYAL